MKTIVIAPDSYKESMSAWEACQAIKTGIRRVYPKANYRMIPIADGGEGTVDALVRARQGKRRNKRVTGPLGDIVQAQYGLLNEGNLAVIELAQASGLELVPPEDRDPLRATSYGTGELIAAALAQGAEKVLVGIGGSATNDGGVGLAQALGVKFFDKRDREMTAPMGGGDLLKIHRIDASMRNRALKSGRVKVAFDVKNPLTGKSGAAHVYGPQKGASPQQVERIDRGLAHLARVAKRDLKFVGATRQGAGAAGGAGFGLMCFAKARAVSGVETILELAGLAVAMNGADLVVTGEGRIDSQTAFGKAPAGVAALARRKRVPIVAIGGAVSVDARKLFAHGFDGIEASLTEISDVADALGNAKRNVTNAAERAARLILLGQQR